MEPLSWVTNPPQAAADGRQTGREGEHRFYWGKKHKYGENFGTLFQILFVASPLS